MSPIEPAAVAFASPRSEPTATTSVPTTSTLPHHPRSEACPRRRPPPNPVTLHQIWPEEEVALPSIVAHNRILHAPHRICV